MKPDAARALAGSPNSKRPNENPFGAIVDTLAEQVADRVAERLGDQTTADPVAVEIPNLTVTIAEAAELLGMSDDHLRRHVLPELRIVRSGRLRLVPVGELEAWIGRNAARALEAVA
jgi:excisionase family DNA binding protein